MAKHIVFDFDGTLADSKTVFISVFNRLSEKHGYHPLNDGNLHQLRRLSITDRCRLLNLPLYKLPFLSAEVLSLYRKSLPEVLLFDGMKEVLQQLRQAGLRIAVISSNSKETIRTFLKQNGLEGLQEVYCSSNILGKDKLIRRFLKNHRLRPEEVIYVGDEHRDLVACRKNGIRMVWVSWGYDAAEALEQEKPDFVAHSPEALLELLQAFS